MIFYILDRAVSMVTYYSTCLAFIIKVMYPVIGFTECYLFYRVDE
jgi:hypothetical protein